MKMEDGKCNVCRRLGQKLFLKGERCFSAKCAFVRRAYGPGPLPKKKRRKTGLSEYGSQFKEKQMVKGIYGLRERQFKRYIAEALAKKDQKKSFVDFLVEKLELRLDNAIFRMGIVNSRKNARQLVGHGHFLVNGKKIVLPSFGLKVGDRVSIMKQRQGKKIFQNLNARLKNYTPPSWLKLEKEKIEAKIAALPSQEEANISANLHAVIEFYSR